MKEYIKNYILERLDSLDGRNFYVCGIPKELYKSDNMTGSITCNASKSQENLEKNMKYFEHTVAYYKTYFGEMEAGKLALDLLRSPEKAECCMTFVYVDEVFNKLCQNHEYKGETIWNKNIYIDGGLLDWIREHLDEAIDEGFCAMEEYTL